MPSSADKYDRMMAHQNPPAAPPPGWEPGYQVDHAAGEATFQGLSTVEAIDPDEASVLGEMGLDAGEWMIQPGSLQIRKWQQRAGTDEWCWYYRITAVRRTRSAGDIDEFVREVRRRKPVKRTSTVPGAQIWATSDWQIGKAGSLEVVVDALAELPDRFEAAWRDAGRPGEIVVIFGGDLVENCDFHYEGQLFQIELHERDQRRLVREFAFRLIDRAARLAGSVLVVAVGGNHGENRAGKGRIMTSTGDNKDVAAIEDIRWACRDSDRYSHVRWALPDEDLTVCVDVDGLRVAVTHGHQIRGANKVESWWDQQAGNHRPAGGASVLFTGHYHAFEHRWLGPRTWIQIPAEDAGSPWYAELRGPGARRAASVAADVAEGVLRQVRLV